MQLERRQIVLLAIVGGDTTAGGQSATGSQSGTTVTETPADEPVVVGAYRDPFAPAG